MLTSPPPLVDTGHAPVDAMPTRGFVRGRVWPSVVISTGLVAGLFTLLFLRNHRFAYLDDRQADGVAKLVDMGRILESGEWPWLSTDVVNSGGYAVEYQNGVFNPVNLAFGVLMGHLDDAALASFLHLLAHLVVLTAAAAWLARQIGLTTPWAVAFATSVGFGPYTVFWGAAWYQAIVSFSWFVLAVAALVALHLTGRQRHGWVLLVATYLCHQSGWPLAIPVLGLTVLVLVLARLVTGHARGATAWIAAWYAGGFLTSLVGLYPLFVSFRFAARSSSISNDANANVAPLEGLLHVADPSYQGWFVNFDGYQLQELPHFYVAWFVLPVLVFWRVSWTSLAPATRALLASSVALLVVTALGSLGPERLMVFRFPTRFLQYSGFFLLLAVALVVVHGRFAVTRRRLTALGGVLALTAVNAVQADPEGALRVGGFTALVAVLALAFVGGRPGTPDPRPGARARAGSGPPWGSVAAVGTVVVMGALALLHPMARGFDWGFPHDLTTVESLSRQDYTLWLGSYAPLEAPDELPSPAPEAAGFYAEYHPSSTGLLAGDRQVNGYSPLAHRQLREHLPIDDQGNFTGDDATTVEMITAVDPATGLTWLELLRIDQVVLPFGPRDSLLDGRLEAPWRRVEQDHTAAYRRAGYELPGLLSYAAPGVDVGATEACPRQHSRECVDVTTAGDGGRVVFARLWFPGYSATLDGEPIDVVAHDDTLVAVDLPPDAAGELVISYRSPGFVPLSVVAVVVVCGLVVAQALAHRRRVRVSEPPA
jgi:hypothetical protein